MNEPPQQDKTVVQPSGKSMETTQGTVMQGAVTPATGGEATLAVPATPPRIPDVELESELGRGGMGVVYRGRQPYLDRRVAVKLLLLERGRGSEEFVKRFQREAKILAGLAHPHIVGCYSAGVTDQGHPYLVMEFIDGPNLRDWVKQRGVLPPAQAVALIREVARALEHANASGIIHRDVKPENILLAKREQPAGGGEGPGSGDFPWTAKLVDLGLARPTTKGAAGEGMHLTMQGVLMGTPSTMAPEQFDDPEHVDYRADIYGLGCVLYQALTGMPAFSSNTLGEILSAKVSGPIPDPQSRSADLPRGVCDLVTWMLARDRTQRPQSYQALIARCDELAADPNRARSRSSKPLALVAIAAVILVGIGVAMALHAGKGEPVATPTPTPAPPAAADRPAAAAPAFDAASPLFVVQDGLLAGWNPHGDGRWALAEEREHAVGGSRGLFAHPLEARPLRLEAKLHPGTSTTLSLGVAVGDQVLLASVKNLGGGYLATIDLGTRDKPIQQLLSSQSLLVTKEVPVVVTIVGKTFTAAIGGIDLKPAPLPGSPTEVVLYVDGAREAPAEVSDLAVSYAK